MVVQDVPLLSVTVPTRGRAEHLRDCVSSILACTGPAFELIVVDQSDDRQSEESLRPQLGDARLRYQRSQTRGVCAARNVGIGLSRGQLLVCTDDDCRVPADWLQLIARGFESRPEAAVLCGRVMVPDTLQAEGFAAAYRADLGETSLQSMKSGFFGITANLALRRTTVEAVGPFDEMLGSGGPLRSGGEPDYFLRVLRAGLRIFDLPEACVTHLGIRRGSEKGALMRKYLFGDGAVFAKHARLGDPSGLDLFGTYLRYWSGSALRNLFKTGRPVGLGGAVALVAGALSSLRFPVDSERRLYRERR